MAPDVRGLGYRLHRASVEGSQTGPCPLEPHWLVDARGDCRRGMRRAASRLQLRDHPMIALVLLAILVSSVWAAFDAGTNEGFGTGLEVQRRPLSVGQPSGH